MTESASPPAEPQSARVGVHPTAQDAERLGVDVAAGDRVILFKYGGTDLRSGVSEVIILSARDVLQTVGGHSDAGDYSVSSGDLERGLRLIDRLRRHRSDLPSGIGSGSVDPNAAARARTGLGEPRSRATPRWTPGSEPGFSSDVSLVAEARTELGKGAARRIRRTGKTPAVVYGHGTNPMHITLPGHDAMQALKHANALLTLVIDGKEQLALARDVQRDPLNPIIEHVDLVIVNKGEQVVVDVPVHIEGQSAPETDINIAHQSVQLKVEVTHIPERVVVPVDGLKAGMQIRAGAITLPTGATLVTDTEVLIVDVAASTSAVKEGEASEFGETDTGKV